MYGIVNILLILLRFTMKMKMVKKYTPTTLLILTLTGLVYLAITCESWDNPLELEPHNHIANELNHRNGEFTAL